MLQVHENALLVTNPEPPSWPQNPGPPPRRGRIVSFSDASRRRLRRLLSVLRWSELGECHFITLTFHRVPEDWHRRFSVWLHARRRAGARYIWRLEPQRRGAPHWHVIIWTPAAALAEAREHWHELAACGSRRHRDYGWHVTRIESYRQAAAYVSKYVAKVDLVEHAILAGHRVWGASRDLPTAPHLEAPVTAAQYYALRRIVKRLYRARSRERRARTPSPLHLHVFLPGPAAVRLADWLGVELRPPPPPPPRARAPGRAAIPPARWNGARWIETALRSAAS